MDQSDSKSAVLDTYHALVSAFTEFLTVAVHTILYERDIYPRESFINARKYNYPVRQNRHPKVCAWIQDAVAAVEAEMLKCTVAQTSVIIYSSATNVPLERYVFSTSSFPIIPNEEIRTPFETTRPDTSEGISRPQTASSSKSRSTSPSPASRPATSTTPAIDLTSQFPGIISRLCLLSSKLKPLSGECSFTIAIELRDQPTGEAPIGHPMPWVPSEPGLQRSDNEKVTGNSNSSSEGLGSHQKKQQGEHLGGVKTTPVRAVEAGPFAMEVWVEEGKEKLELIDPSTTSEETSAT